MSRYTRYDPDEDSLFGDMVPLLFGVITMIVIIFCCGVADRQQLATERATHVLQSFVERYAQQHHGLYPSTNEISQMLPDSVRISLNHNPYWPWKPITINTADTNNGDLGYTSDGTFYEIIGYGGHHMVRVASGSQVFD